MSTDSSAVWQRPRAASAFSVWPPPRGGWLAIASIALIFAGHWAYGALVNDAAFAMGMIAALLTGAVVLTPGLRDDLLRLRTLHLPAVAFALTIIVGVLTLTPWTPGGANPVWDYMGVSPAASTIDKSSTQAELVKLLGLGCLFLVGAAVGGDDRRARYAVRATIVAGVVFGLWAFLGTMSGLLVTQGRRLEAHFLNANVAGMLFAILALLAVSEVQTRASGTWSNRLTARMPALLAFLLLFACLIATVSRGALIAELIGGFAYVALLLISGRVKLSRALFAILACLAVIAALIVLSRGSIIDRMALAGENSIDRTAVWQAHWQAFVASPLFGYGLGTSETVNKTLITVANFRELVVVRGLMNVYLQWLEQAGLIGTIPMFATIGLVLRTTFTGTLRRSRSRATLCALLACDVVVLAHGATDFGLEVYSMASMWAWLLGLQFSLAQGSSAR